MIPVTIHWNSLGIIESIELIRNPAGELLQTLPCITPPLVNAHIHVESSMVVPSQFGPAMLSCGVGASISDPHEIANVLGVPGIQFMLENQIHTPMRILFGAPSCVPATHAGIETSGAVLTAQDVDALLADPRIHYLAEVMNFPGVLAGDGELLAKIAAAKRRNKPIDGHAPCVRGDAIARYAAAGIETDHESVSLEEALEKLQYGMKILIREGSAAKNFDALWSLICSHTDSVMLCSDDLHPDDFFSLNINELCARALERGASLKQVMQVASRNAVAHYRIPLGQLAVGDRADMVLWNQSAQGCDFRRPQETILDGCSVWSIGESIDGVAPQMTPNLFRTAQVFAEDFIVPLSRARAPVIQVLDQQIVTETSDKQPRVGVSSLETDTVQDVLKLAVINRYCEAAPAVCFVSGVGLQRGAIASSVAHDSHNIVACGVDDRSLARAVDQLVAAGGGVSCVAGGDAADRAMIVPLPVAGLMSTHSVKEVAAQYQQITSMAKEICGCTLSAPFMTLSFLALPVIPKLKLTDRGLFDVEKFDFV